MANYFRKLRSSLDSYLEKESVEKIRQAYLLADKAHKGQKRRSGEPYISHPAEVAKILAEMHLDYQSIAAAILHDVIEDTDFTKDDLVSQFGETIAELVDGVSKLTQIKFETKAEAQAENFRKMLLAMVKDIRVIIIKLADRLHNMRTILSLPSAKRIRIARETMDIYAPIANRLGMHSIRVELEDLAFQALHPTRAKILTGAVRKARGNRKEILKIIEKALKKTLSQGDFPPCRVYGREKHIYSIYKKMRTKRLPFSEIMDVYAFRIVVDSVDTCYRVLGAAHNLYKPVPERFKDYIAIPKANGYQSLHTILFGPYGVPIELQIRTYDMDSRAANGIAAHWLYKDENTDSNEPGAHVKANQWLKRLLEMQKSSGSSLEFIEHVKVDLFPDEVYVFTPKGDIRELPNGATAVDFAYAVHSDVGNRCVAVKIDRHLSPLSTVLTNGQTVEVITAPSARPNPAWLNFIVTGKARSNIRHFLKNQQRSESVALGQRLLEKALSSLNIDADKLPPEQIHALLAEREYKEFDDLLEDIGLGNQMPLVIAHQLTSDDIETTSVDENEKPLAIKGTEGMVVTYARCCRPIPGDAIIGHLSTGRGIVVHRDSCKNTVEFHNQPNKRIDVVWEAASDEVFSADLLLVVENKRGVLATVSSAISETSSNIRSISINEQDGLYSEMLVTVEVRDRTHLANIIRRLRRLKIVSKIHRH